MTTGPELRPGDEVAVQMPCVVGDDGSLHVRKIGVCWWPSQAHVEDAGGSITVTLPVDHPSRDLVGAVRGRGADVWVKVDKYDGDPSFTGIWWNVMNGEERVGDDVEDFPVIGAVPGTPAAELLARHITEENQP